MLQASLQHLLHTDSYRVRHCSQELQELTRSLKVIGGADDCVFQELEQTSRRDTMRGWRRLLWFWISLLTYSW